MPEFAEVNKQVKWLRERVSGWHVQRWGNSAKGNFAEQAELTNSKQVLDAFFLGATVETVTQRGKHVVFRLSTGVMTAHLMFKGRWSLEGEDFLSNYKHHREPPTAKSNNFWLECSGGRINFHEPEYKGKVHAYPDVTPGQVGDLEALGPEVLVTPETDPDFTAEWTLADFRAALARVRAPVKTFLLDQKKQAGLGNMYVCESLYEARVSPERPANQLSDAEAEAVHTAARRILREAIDSDLDYDRVLKVYKREADPLGNAVECDTVGGRDTYWVPAVQK